ncbi:TauD/TfdA family dioxygenase [Rothia sp. AR01]|uniref:TauD/TfdA family dioxygenase n=1 Tax=Rothia santali TaxID=2949643 RepID=A0A9X2HLJ2_9MICC|nr:TauD/TfdA family dioxygenase [Rothia santali]MCP3427173.1 TauD/TfdA family dioxygenase [Rothia santali]
MTIDSGTTAPAGLAVRRLGQHIGAEVRGLDLSGPLDPATVARVRELLHEHKALVFKDAGVTTDEEQARFAAHFGPLTAAHPTVRFTGQSSLNVLPVDSESSVANKWHTDVTFVLNPPQLSTLRAVVLPDYGGETLIANAAAAYAGLPEELRRFADTLWAVHSNDSDYVRPDRVTSDAERSYQEQFVSSAFRTAHPVVRVHPLSGERGLFIGAFAQRLRILGVTAEESLDILRILQRHVTRPEHVVRVAWEPGQLVLFDNRITQHYAIDNYDRSPRKLNRITVAGDVPAAVDGRRSYALEGDASDYSPVVEV